MSSVPSTRSSLGELAEEASREVLTPLAAHLCALLATLCTCGTKISFDAYQSQSAASARKELDVLSGVRTLIVLQVTLHTFFYPSVMGGVNFCYWRFERFLAC